MPFDPNATMWAALAVGDGVELDVNWDDLQIFATEKEALECAKTSVLEGKGQIVIYECIPRKRATVTVEDVVQAPKKRKRRVATAKEVAADEIPSFLDQRPKK
jgi:hypothetical protein